MGLRPSDVTTSCELSSAHTAPYKPSPSLYMRVSSGDRAKPHVDKSFASSSEKLISRHMLFSLLKIYLVISLTISHFLILYLMPSQSMREEKNMSPFDLSYCSFRPSQLLCRASSKANCKLAKGRTH